MPADREPQYAKHQRQHQRQTWLRQGLSIDQIAHRFRQTHNIGALTAYRWANNQTQLETANTYSEQFLDPDERLYPQRVSEYEKWPHEQGGREPPLSVLERFAVLYHTTPTRLITAILNDTEPDEQATSHAEHRGVTRAADVAGGDEPQMASGLQGWPAASGPAAEPEHDLLDRLALEMRLTSTDPAKVEYLEQVTAIHRKLYHSATPSARRVALRASASLRMGPVG